MAADLLHGFQNTKLWFPSKYFSLNAASITVITIAMKLPLDLSSDMRGYMDQVAKVGSLDFMCVMMANFMPSLAAMDNKTLLANIIEDAQKSTVEKLRQHVKRYWVMAKTGSPQFVMASNPLSTVSGIILEKYWTQKLCEWERSPIHFQSSSRSRTLVYNLKSAIISLCIWLQKVIVILCKLISLIPTVIPIVVVYCLYCWKSLKARSFTPPVISRTDNTDRDLQNYVLLIHDDVELAEKTLKRISNSMNSFILKAEKEQKQNKDLLELLEKSTEFKGVENFDTDRVQPLLSIEPVNSWSLPIVTLTCIAVSLPNIRKDTIKSFLRSVGEGLSYTHQVEESLNCEKEYENIRKATIILWNEVENKRKWLDKTLELGPIVVSM
ncbi:hypothetical protein L1987_49460 [Smallanthus sonchifolius]|uniref:Uncharacterized protein n=1 Tax=Smallanthus sonchifolius TaxID=185202 RepID=A0ACB9FWE5_9ASTR|nr:hypothetical protein L1987_49460 [Smallanthus sonchifolius]